MIIIFRFFFLGGYHCVSIIELMSTITSEEPATMSSGLGGVIIYISGSLAGFMLLLITLSVLTCIILYSKRQKTRFQGENNGTPSSPDLTNNVALYNVVEGRSEHVLSNQDPSIANDGHILSLMNYGVRPSKMNSGDISTTSSASYGVTPSRMNSGDITTSSNAPYGKGSSNSDVEAIYTEIA